MGFEPLRATVTLLIFSGRSNPEWVVRGEEADHLSDLVTTAVSGDETDPPAEPGLGYQGFLVRVLNGATAPLQAHVYADVVAELAGDATRYWRDTAGCESWLLEQAAREGMEELLAQVRDVS